MAVQKNDDGPVQRYSPSTALDILIVVCVLLFSALAYLWFLPVK